MKIVVPILVAMLLVACIGQQKIASQEASSFDCEVLLKKQRQQFRKAIRQGSSDHRRKPAVVKGKDKRTSITAARSERNPQLAPAIDKVLHDFAAYSPSLVLSLPHAFAATSTSKEQIHDKQMLSAPRTLVPERLQQTDASFQKYINDTWIWPAILLGAMIGMLSVGIFPNHAKMLTRWGKSNKWKARSALVLMKTGTGVACVWLGHELYNAGVMVPELMKVPTLAVLASAFVFYPSKYFASGAPAFGYLERKCYDATIFAAGALVMLYSGNHFDVSLQRAGHVQTVASIQLTLQERTSRPDALKISIVKKQFKEKLSTLLQDPKKEITKTNKTILTIVAVLAAIILTFGVAALSCSIACSGAEAVGLIAFVGGAALIVWGLVSVIRAIHNRPTKKRTRRAESAT